MLLLPSVFFKKFEALLSNIHTSDSMPPVCNLLCILSHAALIVGVILLLIASFRNYGVAVIAKGHKNILVATARLV